MLAFVTNSTSPFNLGAEEIVYLNDIGVPASVVTAMIQHDQTLKGLPVDASQLPPAPVSDPTTNAFPQEVALPGLYAPQLAESEGVPEVAPEPAPPPVADAGYTVFYDSLAPYGTWVNVAGWGPCWQPRVVIVNPAWQPYCHGGRWLYTDCGWYWLSGYSWGWAPFHYGRWFRHHRIGWCWTPDRVWGPSWVCWRYSGNHCGWAPLPPRAVFRPGVGLTYHGRPVRAGFGFGLRSSAYTFVDAGRFRDHHLDRHALRSDQALRAYHQTTPSASIVENNRRVLNRGIPASRIAAATRTEVRKVNIQPVNSPAARGNRGERFDSARGTLAVSRPQFPSSTVTASPSNRRTRTESRSGTVGSTFAPSTQRAAPGSSPRPEVGAAAQPRAGQSFATRTENPAIGSPSLTITRPRSEPNTIRTRPEAATRPSSPVIIHRSERPDRGTAHSSAASRHESPSRQSSVAPARSDPAPRQSISQPPAPRIETPRPAPASPSRETISRPAVRERPQPVTTPAWRAPTHSQPARSTSRAVVPSVRSERQPASRAPSFSAPAPAPRAVPAPSISVPRHNPSPSPARSAPARTFTPSRGTPAPSFSAPRSAPSRSFSSPPARSSTPSAASPAPRVRAMESRPAPSASPPPRASASPGHGRSSSGQRGR